MYNAKDSECSSSSSSSSSSDARCASRHNRGMAAASGVKHVQQQLEMKENRC